MNAENKPQRRYARIDHLALEYGTSKEFWRAAVREGRLSALRPSSRLTLIPLDEVEAMMAGTRVRPKCAACASA